jgi:hypothetical protein
MYYLHKKKVGVSLGTTRGGPKTNSSPFVEGGYVEAALGTDV